MARTGSVVVALASVGLLACGGDAGGQLFGWAGGGPTPGGSGDDAGTATDAPATNPVEGDSAAPTPSEDAGRVLDSGGSQDTGSSSPDAGSGCYSEPYDPTANVADLASAYTSAAWLTSSMTAMQRRYPTGYFVLNAEQSDPQLPSFADPSSWGALMESLMTMVHEETHGWDFDNAQGTSHPYLLLDTLQITVPQATTWPRSEILQYITDTSTQQYDQTYLTGTQGTYDAIFLFEELNAYSNGLAAITAVGDQITQQISARDGVVAHLYYLELYLKDGRMAHSADYAAIQADPSWQKLARYEWARGHFWDGQARPNPNLDIGSTPIWAHVNDPANLAEIQQFTGEAPDAVACHP